jgi:hypothetical protein
MNTHFRTLYRPVGIEELELIRISGMRKFPPRLPEQPIFYPVMTREYAQFIAEKWNTKDTSEQYNQAGFVLEFDLNYEYAAQFEEHVVGSSNQRELWIPAEELENFNRHLIGRIRVIDAFYGESYQGPFFDLKMLNSSMG